MAQYRHSVIATQTADHVFSYLADTRNLPDYFPRMTNAEPLGDNEPGDTDTLNTAVAARAWLLVDPDTRSLRWGSDGPEAYHGVLHVHDTGDEQCEIDVELVTAEDEREDVQQGLEHVLTTLAESAAQPPPPAPPLLTQPPPIPPENSALPTSTGPDTAEIQVAACPWETTAAHPTPPPLPSDPSEIASRAGSPEVVSQGGPPEIESAGTPSGAVWEAGSSEAASAGGPRAGASSAGTVVSGEAAETVSPSGGRKKTSSTSPPPAGPSEAAAPA